MKKINLTLCIAASMAVTVSCGLREEFGSDGIKANAISFILDGAATKAGADNVPSVISDTFYIGEHDGQTLYLQESIVCLNNEEPQTKGTPAYTENFAELYGSFSAVAFDATATSFTTPLLAAASFGYDADKGWYHEYRGEDEPWKANDLRFFMHMPETMAGVSGTAFSQTAITFDFDGSSLTSATSQQDLLFATRVVSKSTYKPKAAKVLFYHALSGVKFAIGNSDSDTKITSVKFAGLASKGRCTVTPAYGNWSGSPASNAGSTNGSKSSDCVAWTNLSGTYSPSQSFESLSGAADYTQGDYHFADSFYAAGNEKNLNDDEASMTFWFIPQQLSADVKLEVAYTYKGKAYTQTLDFGTLAKGSNAAFPIWKAGELRTYTLTASAVGISVTDTVSGLTKSNIVIKNEGSTDTFIRAKIVGNWINAGGDVLGSWSETASCGTFTSDNGFPTLNNVNWKKGSDGYYYYKKYLSGGASAKENLFNSFTVTSIPDISSKSEIVSLEMVLLVQAVKADNALTYFKEAWGTEMVSWIGTPTID